MADSDYESTDTSPSTDTNKYYQVLVPNFPLDTATPPKKGNSFVRLGSPPTKVNGQEPDGYNTSADLIEKAFKVNAEATATLREEEDWGGWWDHTDGDRVSTTAKSKVESIGANYTLFVKGKYKLVQPDGVSSESWTGTESAPLGGTPNTQAAVPASRPTAATTGDILTGKWATRILTYTGSATVRVPVVYSETYAGSVTSVTDTTGDNISTTVAAGKKTSTTTVTGMNTTTNNYNGGNETNTTVDGGDNVTKTWVKGAGNVLSHTAAAGVMSTTEAAGIETLQVATNISSLAVAALNLAIKAGVITNINAGATANLNFGPVLALHLPSRLAFTIDDNGFCVNKTKATAAANRLSGIENTLATTQTNLNAVDTRLSQQVTHLSQNAVMLGVEYEAIFAEINLV